MTLLKQYKNTTVLHVESQYNQFQLYPLQEQLNRQKVDEFEKLQDRAIRYVENDMYYNMDIDVLYHKHNVQKLSM